MYDNDSNYNLIDINGLTNNWNVNFYQNIDFDLISVKDLEAAFRKLKPKKTAGPDNIPCYILKACKDYLIYPLLVIFNKSLKTSIFPIEFKRTRLTPIFKKGDKNKIDHYRPIAILNCTAKLFEFVIYDKLYAYFTRYKFINFQ